jgi:hypothetical protein
MNEITIKNIGLLTASDIANISVQSSYSKAPAKALVKAFDSLIEANEKGGSAADRDLVEVAFAKLHLAGVWTHDNLADLEQRLPVDHFLHEKIQRTKRLIMLRSDRLVRVVG